MCLRANKKEKEKKSFQNTEMSWVSLRKHAYSKALKFYHQKRKVTDKNSDIFHISAQNIDCEYSLEPPRRGSSNEYPQFMFLRRNKKNNVFPCKPQFYSIKVRFDRWPKWYGYVFVMFWAASRERKITDKTLRTFRRTNRSVRMPGSYPITPAGIQRWNNVDSTSIR